MIDRDVLARVLPFAIYMGFIIVADVLGRLGWSGEDLRWLYPLKVALVAGALWLGWRHYHELTWRALPWRVVATAVGVGVLVLVLWLNLDADWMVAGSSVGFEPRTDSASDYALLAARLLGAAVVVPVMEELFWRSFLMRWLVAPDFLRVPPAQITLRAGLITMVLFGVEHNLWLAGMVAGLAYGLLYVRSQNLWVPILAHAVTNGLLGVWIVSTGMGSYW